MRSHHLPLAVVVIVGALLRAIPVLGSDFPLNDGGMFVAMADDIRRNGFLLPEYTSYNGLRIPFAYPPMGLYVAAVLGGIGIAPLELLRWIPLTASVLAIPVAHGIFLRLLDHPARALVATAAFAAMPNAYEWLIGGGGLTRSLGFTLALACVLCAVDMLRSGGRMRAVVTGLLGGLTVLAHPQAAIFAAVSVLILAAFWVADRRRTLWNIGLAGVVAGLVAVPWLIAVLLLHGPAPILSAGQTGGSPLDGLRGFLSLRFSGGAVEVLGAFAAFGVFVAALNRKWWLAIWIVALFLVGARKSLIFATIPASLAVSVGFADLLRLLRIGEPVRATDFVRSRAGGMAALVLLAGVVSAGVSHAQPESPLNALSTDQRAAMQWASRETPPDATFLVISGTSWNLDAAAEWLPVIADRSSVVTVQGFEWLGADAFQEQRGRHQWLQDCAVDGAALCVDEWIDVVGPVDYVYLADSATARAFGYDCCHHLAGPISTQLGGTVVFENGQVVILSLPSGASAPRSG